MDKLIIATRGSKLALTQTGQVADLIRAANPGLEVELKVIKTRGDLIIDKPLPEIGGKGLFTAELEEQLLDGGADLAVHSLKDLPVEFEGNFALGAVPKRAPASDALIFPEKPDGDLPAPGSTVATGSARRISQLVRSVPGLKTVQVRGNVDTRLRKLEEGQFDVLMLASAGLARMGLAPPHIIHLDPETFLPAPAQGALGLQIRDDRDDVRAVLAPLEDEATRFAVFAERSLLFGLGGGCSVPVGAYARMAGDKLILTGGVFSPDGEQAFVETIEGDPKSATDMGKKLAETLIKAGAGPVLEQYQ